MELSFDEIQDDRQFEDLAVSYVEALHRVKKNILEIDTRPSGVGVDGGRDIFAKIRIHDGLYAFERRWVIQCKFHANSISTSEIADINIPSLVHSYDAHGYLLICRTKPTSKLTSFIENLGRECRFKYLYRILYGDPYLKLIRDHPRLIQQYFPKYSDFLKNRGK